MGKYDPRLVQTSALAAPPWAMNRPAAHDVDIEKVVIMFEADVTVETPAMVDVLLEERRGLG